MFTDSFLGPWLAPLLGGLLIGLATSSLLVFNGRVAGISGIVGGLLHPTKGDTSWRLAFLGGMLVGGLVLSQLMPQAFAAISQAGSAANSSTGAVNLSLGTAILGGALVGFGTRLGSGCTSGHGVCGVGRLSPRSIVATLTFISSGAVAVYLTHT